VICDILFFMRVHNQFGLWILIILLLVGCGSATGPVVTPTEMNSGGTSAYPQPGADGSYPAPANMSNLTGYPGQLEGLPQHGGGAIFALNSPLQAGSTEVTGQAPPNLQLAIVDITYNGVVLGSDPSDDRGNFAIAVSPLQAGHRIGITFAQLDPGRTLEEMSVEYYEHRGPGFMNVPNVGIFFDTALVTP
jgi:hypothetical protein